MEFLKPVLGDALYAQVEEKLKGGKLQLADVSGGAYVSREKHEAAMAQLTAAQETLKGLNGKNAAEVGAEIAAWKAKAETAEAEADKRIAAAEMEGALSAALSSARARNVRSLRGMLDMGAIAHKGGKLTGLQEQLDALRKSDPYLFEPLPAGGAGFSGGMPPGEGEGWKEQANAAIRGAFS